MPVVALSLASADGLSPPMPRNRLRLPTSSSTSSLASLATMCGTSGGMLPLTSLGVTLAAQSQAKRQRFRLPPCVELDQIPRRPVFRAWSGDAVRTRKVAMTKDQDQAKAKEQEDRRSKHTVDKTNPFIGYFQQSEAGMHGPGSKLAAIPEREWNEDRPKHAPRQAWKASGCHERQNNQQCEEETSEMDRVTWLQKLQVSPSEQHRNPHSVSGSSEQSVTADTSSTLNSGSTSDFRGDLPASRFEQDFSILCSIGQGGQGSVYKVRSRIDGCEYAIKKVMLPKAVRRDSAVLELALREVRAMALMPCHPHVVRYHTAWLEEVEDTSNNAEQSKVSSNGADAHIQGKTDTPSSNADFLSYCDEASIDSLSSFEGSMGGFEFAESSRSSMVESEDDPKKTATTTHLAVVHEELREDESVSSQSSEPDTTLVLYIQMELCRMPSSMAEENGPEEEEGDSFHRLINRVTRKADAPITAPVRSKVSAIVHPSFSSWLRSSVDARSAPETALAKHKEGLKLFLGILDGVQHMHKCGVIHRDLKPENVFLHGDTAKIGDFGLSKSIFSECNDTLAQAKHQNVASYEEGHTTALGTFTYASPEQLGNAYQPDDTSNAHRVVKIARYSFKSDIFALGVILLELCCPCKTMMERSQVLTAVRHGVVPRQAVEKYPVEMGLVLRMTAIDPAERPSAEEVIEQLQPLLDTTANTTSAQSILSELRDLQQRFAMAAHQLRDRPQSAQHLDALANELNDKVQSLSHALA